MTQTLTKDLAGAIAVTRFGMGAKAGEIARASGDARAYLIAQIDPRGAQQPQPNAETSAQRFAEYREFVQERRDAKMAGDAKSDPVVEARKLIREGAGTDFLARMRLGATTDDGFKERWALFWANHFTVSAQKVVTANLVGPFEQEAIRPHVFGRFEDLLVASSNHPAMLLYLDQAQSIGPDSRLSGLASLVGKKAGLNENLAREIMELHTVGVEAGYSQADVTEFARAMTGWSVGGLRNTAGEQGRFFFREQAHEPGVRTVMGKRYAEAGVEQAHAVLKDLAASPHTARHVSLKLARHFVSDDPPPALVARLRASFQNSGGDLSHLARTLIDSPEAWNPAPAKFKTPYEFMISSWRAAGIAPSDVTTIAPTMTAMGQKPFSAPSPKGWPEEAQVWCAPDAVIKRMGWSEAFAQTATGDRDPIMLADNALGDRLGSASAKAIARAETRPEGLSIMLMTPEFQRR
jgi:uncharacterized protein (DUF1800 family)